MTLEDRKEFWQILFNELFVQAKQSLSHIFLRIYHQAVLCWLEVESSKKENILEVGCGCGWFTKAFMQRFRDWKLFAFDPDEDAVLRTMDHCGLTAVTHTDYYTSKDSHVTLCQANVCEGLSLEKGRFHKVIAIMVFHHIDPNQYDSALYHLYRLLRPGGKMIVIDAGKPDNWYGRIFHWLFKGHAFSDGCAEAVVNQAGYIGFAEITYARTYFGWTHQVVMTKPK